MHTLRANTRGQQTLQKRVGALKPVLSQQPCYNQVALHCAGCRDAARSLAARSPQTSERDSRISRVICNMNKCKNRDIIMVTLPVRRANLSGAPSIHQVPG